LRHKRSHQRVNSRRLYQRNFDGEVEKEKRGTLLQVLHATENNFGFSKESFHASKNSTAYSVGDKPLHKDVIPSARAIFIIASCRNKNTYTVLHGVQD